MNPSSPNTDNSQGGPETARNPYAQGNSFDRPGAMKPIISRPDQPAQPLPQQPIMGRTGGDIVLQPEAPKKSKKPLVLIIILILVLVGAFAAYVFVNSKSGQNLLGQANPATSFNRYANYLLYGEDSDKPLEEEYNDTKVYTIEKLNGSDDANAFFDVSQQLFDNFYSDFYKMPINNEELKSLVDDYRGNLSLVKIHSNTEDIEAENFISYYIKNNAQNTKKLVEEKYSPFLNSDLETVRQYGQNQSEYWILTADLLKKADGQGCLTGNAFDYACVNKVMTQEEGDAISQKGNLAMQILQKAQNSVVRDCWTISKILGSSS